MVKNLKRKERLKLGLLKLGEIAREVGLLPSAIRYYSNLGLIKISDYTQGKYRLFKKEDTLYRLIKIKEMKEKGMTLDQIKKRLI